MTLSLARDSAIYGAAAILSRLVAVLLVPIYGHFLRPAELGAYDLVLGLAACASFAIALEMAQAVGRFVLEAADPAARARYASSAFGFVLGAYALFFLACVAFSPALARWLTGSAGDARIAWLAAAAIVSFGLMSHVQNQARYQNQAFEFALSNLVLALGTTAGAIVFVWQLGWGLAGALASFLLGTLSAMTLAFALLRPRLAPGLEWPPVRRMLAYSLPLVPAGAAGIALQFGDRFVIKEVLSLQDLGLYGVAARFASVVSLFVGAIQAPLLPFVLGGAADSGTAARVERAARYFLLLAALCIVALACFARELVALFAAAEFQQAAPLVPLSAAALALGGCQLFAPGLLIARRTALHSAILVAAVVLQLALDAWLLPYVGIIGAPLMAAFAAVLLIAALIRAGQPYFAIPYRWARYGAIIALALAAGAAGYALPVSPWALAAKLGLLAITAAVLYLQCPHTERRAMRALAASWLRLDQGR